MHPDSVALVVKYANARRARRKKMEAMTPTERAEQHEIESMIEKQTWGEITR